jgi:hypothetical protein
LSDLLILEWDMKMIAKGKQERIWRATAFDWSRDSAVGIATGYGLDD